VNNTPTPTNNEYDPEWCDSCESFVVADECPCNNNGGWAWMPFHNGQGDDC